MQFSCTYFNVPEFFFQYYYTDNIHEKLCDTKCISFANFITFVAICFKYFYLYVLNFCFFHCILYLRMHRILENFKCLTFA